ncbi:hypothetical protein [Planococcus chinensis]|uniref:Transposase n=1 Tax=Planococcus chinensis TaxID=272917 RepID=A0ABW4QF28_9BACL
MRYLQYKGLIEREYKKSLKKIMYEICVEKGLNASDGAKSLGIAKEIFVYWRHHYRFERRQLLFDQTVKELDGLKDLYAEDMKTIKLDKPLQFEDEESIRGLEEVIVHMIDYYKYLHYNSDGLSLETAKLPLFQFSHNVVERYKEGALGAEVNGHTK